MRKTWASARWGKAAALALAACGAQQAAAVNKCTGKDAAVVYQDAPCTNAAADTRRLYITAAPAASPPPARPVQPVPAPAASAVPTGASPRAPVPLPAVIAPPPRTQMEARADACLNWYRPHLRDPRSAYWREAHYVQDTLNITVVATNGFGGFVNKGAACDFRDGEVDEGWTKTQASRRGW